MIESNQSVIPFQFEGSGIRVLDQAGDPWFVLADACRILGLDQPSRAADRLDDDEKSTLTLSMGHINQGLSDNSPGTKLTIINYPGLCTLVLRCRDAVTPGTVPYRFRKWVTAEVLPAIRKTGRYGAETDPIKVLNDPAAMRGLLLTYSEKVLALQAENAELAPKAEALDRIATAGEGSLNITMAAKALQVRPKDLFAWLNANRWIYRRNGSATWLGYQDKTVTGYLEHKVTTVHRTDGTEKIVEQVLITAKGIAKLSGQMKPPALCDA